MGGTNENTILSNLVISLSDWHVIFMQFLFLCRRAIYIVA
jgi:hypothetical protein